MQGRYRDGIPEDEKRKLLGCLFSVAILIAPFIALLYGTSTGLVVLALALLTSIWFAWKALDETSEPMRSRLRLLIAVNSALLILTIAALIWIRAK